MENIKFLKILSDLAVIIKKQPNYKAIIQFILKIIQNVIYAKLIKNLTRVNSKQFKSIVFRIV